MRVPFPAVALCASLLAAPALADELRCTGRIGAVQLDNIAVPDGATCLLQGTRAKGNIVVGTGARLRAENVQVIGNLQAEGAADVQVAGRSRFGGSVQIKQGGPADISGARIGGDLQLEDNRGPTRVSGNRIGGNLQCQQNRPAPRGGGNRAASKEDQCERL